MIFIFYFFPQSLSSPQIFSIEDPSLPNEMMGNTTGVDLSINTNSSIIHTQQTWLTDQSLTTGERLSASGRRTALQVAWTSGMGCSSNSSSDSSLASAGINLEVHTTLLHRKDSGASGNSGGSASSENQLLPTKNNLSKSPTKKNKRNLHQSHILTKSEESSASGNLTVGGNNVSYSPTLSRNSWARSSDTQRASLAMEFTVLGFDDSSLDYRPSDTSSYASLRPRSISPHNVSGLFQDVHSRLRATIAATIAAATNGSSTESTPSKTRSLSHRSQTSGQEDSMSLSMPASGTSSPKHNCAFLDSGSSYNERGKDGSIESLRSQREGLSSLPDIMGAMDLDQLSDIASGEAIVHLNSPGILSPSDLMLVSKSTKTKMKEIHSNSSPHIEDSTLTVSKLDNNRIHKPISYIKATKHNTSHCANPYEENEPIDLSFKKVEPYDENKKDSHNGDSPFSDKELVSVMAKSLQSYISVGSSKDSQLPEREGLALTIDDLRFSRETSPSRSGSTVKTGEIKRSQSASSLFHDSFDSSPASSASKMNRSLAHKTSEKDLSPNGLKQINAHHYEDIHLDTSRNAVATPSHALKFIMNSYGHIKRPSNLSPNDLRLQRLGSPREATNSNKSSPGIKSNHTSLMHKETTSPQSVYYSARSIKSSVTSQLPKSPLYIHGERNSPIDSPLQIHHLEQASVSILNEKDSYHNSALHHHHHLSTRDETSSYKKNLLSVSERHKSSRDKATNPHAGVSSTKKLNISHKDMNLLEYSKSPCRRNPHLNNTENERGLDPIEYVAGEYQPPLCGNISQDDESDSIERNLNHSKYAQNWANKDKVLFDKSVDIGLSNVATPKDYQNFSYLKNQMKSDFADSKQSNLEVTDHIQNMPYSNSKHRLPEKLSAHTKSSSHSRKSFPGDEMTEAELHHSAQKVANYFNKVLDVSKTPSTPPEYAERRQSPCYRIRQPLQQINISPLNSDIISRRGQNNFDVVNSPVYLLPSQKRQFQQLSKGEDQPISRPFAFKKCTRPPVHNLKKQNCQHTSYKEQDQFS